MPLSLKFKNFFGKFVLVIPCFIVCFQKEQIGIEYCESKQEDLFQVVVEIKCCIPSLLIISAVLLKTAYFLHYYRL